MSLPAPVITPPPPPPLAPAARHRYGGLFWPAVLIVVGLLALLVNIGAIPADRLYRLWDLWPVLLVVVGLLILVRRSDMPSPASIVAGVLIVLLAVAGAAVYVAAGPSLGSATLDASNQTGGLTSAAMQIDVGGASVNISGDGQIGADLYRAHIDYAGNKPDVRFDSSNGRVVISQNGQNSIFMPSQRFSLDLKLNTSVAWDITVNAGGATEKLDLTGVQLKSLSLNSGGSTGDITLGAPQGTVPITISGGGLTMHLHRPSDASASVQLSGAAVSLTFDGRHHAGLGSVQDSSGGGSDRYDITVSGAGCTVTMDTAAAMAYLPSLRSSAATRAG